jgi:hypothetical protein
MPPVAVPANPGNPAAAGQWFWRKMGPLAIVMGASWFITDDYFRRQIPLTETRINAISDRQRQEEWQAQFGDFTGSPIMTGINRLVQRGRIRFNAFSERNGARLEALGHTVIDNIIPLVTAGLALQFGFGREIGQVFRALGSGMRTALAPLLPQNANLWQSTLTGLSAGTSWTLRRGVVPSVKGIWQAWGPLGTLAVGALGVFGFRQFGNIASGMQSRQDLQNDLERIRVL